MGLGKQIDLVKNNALFGVQFLEMYCIFEVYKNTFSILRYYMKRAVKILRRLNDGKKTQTNAN